MRKKLSVIKPKNIKFAVFDIETYKWIHPYAVGFYDGINYKQFLGKDCIKDFISYVAVKKYRGYRIYAHNGGKFDFNFLMDILKNRKFNIDMVFQGSRCLLLKLYTHLYRNDEGSITHSNVIQFVDSIGLLKFGLDALTKDFDVKHKKLNFMDKKGSERDYEYLYRLYKEDDIRFHDYLRNDVYGLYEVLVKFNDLITKNNGQMGLTIASTSLKTFQTGYLSSDIRMTDRDTNTEMKIGYYGGRCFSSDTELLTNNGWKNYLNIKNSDLIATYKNGNMEYKPSMWIHKEFVNEEMINIKGKNIDLLCTNDHRVYYKSKNKKGKVKVCHAKDIPKNQIAIPTSAIYQNNKNLDKNIAYLLGFIIGDGSVDNKGKRTYIFQSKPEYCKKLEHIFKKEKIKYTKKLIKEKGSEFLGYKRNYNTYEYYISCKHGFHKFFENKLPKRDLLSYGNKTLLQVFNGMIESDGHKRQDSNGYRYYTSNKYIADFMMELSIKLGYRCNIYKRKNRKEQYDLNISVGGYINLNINKHHNLKKINYSGIIWSVKTENKTVIARRNGKHLVSGNTEIFRMMLPDDKYRCYDVNSLYPYVMFNNEFPVSKPKTVNNVTPTMIKEICGITKCRVNAPKDLYLPVLPYKLKIGGHNKLVFPLGKFDGYWDNIQLKKAMELGYKIEPQKMLVFKTDYIFKDYVTNFYKLKSDSKPQSPSYILAKLMLNCWDLKTEVLTPDGWKKYNEINKGDKIYQFNKDIGKITETIVNDKIVKYSNETYHLHTPHIDFKVTPNHRVLFKKYKTNSKFLVTKMKDLPDTHIKFKTSSILNNDSNGIDISDNLIKIIAWIITEGNYQYTKNNKFTMINIRQSKKVNLKNYLEIKKLLKNEKIKFNETFDGCERFYINSKSSKFLKILLPDKYNIPDWVFELNLKQKRLFIDTLIKGDGTESNGKIAYTQKWEKQIDDLQHLCSICGYSTVKGKSNNCYILYIRKNDYSGINSFFNKYNGKSILEKQKGKEKVWGINVNSGFVIIRRNGRVIITGQSLYGKFAQNQDSEMVVKINNPKDLMEMEIVGVVDADHNLFRVKTESKGNFFIPQISIHVTALAQLRLYKFMEDLIEKGKLVSYCDTDSLFTNGYLPTSDKLGDMKREYNFSSGYFLLPKTYCIVKPDGSVKVKAKGFTRDFQKQLTEKSFKKALYKKDYSDFKITSDVEVFNSMKTSFVRHHNFVSTDFRKKSISAKYDKRKILKDYNTFPLII